jgi:hypothetical protein
VRRWPKLRPRAEVTELDPVINPRTHVIPAAGWSSPVARQAHNLKAAGSNPAPATIFTPIIKDLQAPRMLGAYPDLLWGNAGVTQTAVLVGDTVASGAS